MSRTAPASGSLDVPSARRRLEIRRAIVAEKLATAVLGAMRAGGLDLWITFDRENQRDPLHVDFGAPYSGAGAATLFFDRGAAGLESIFVGSPQPADSAVASLYVVQEYGGTSAEEVMRLIGEAAGRRRPGRIGVNMSSAAGTADGLTATLERQLVEALGPTLAPRIVSAESAVHAFRANRTPLETEWYTALQRWTADAQEQVLAAVTSGHTTALDLACAFEDAAHGLGLAIVRDHGRYPLIVWLGDRAPMPGVVPAGPERPLRAGSTDQRDFALQPGDLVTLDGGLRFLGFSSDMKRTAYLLRPGETAPPASLLQAWHQMRAVAERYARHLRAGVSGEEVFDSLMTELAGVGFEALSGSAVPPRRPQIGIYGHPVGNAVHDIGPKIAAHAPGPRFSLQPGEWVSVEFHLVVPAEDAPAGAWFLRFEQTAQVRAGGAAWLVPPQERLQLISPRLPPTRGAPR